MGRRRLRSGVRSRYGFASKIRDRSDVAGELIDQTRRGPVLVRAEGGREAMLVSVEQYETQRQAAVQRMFAVMDEIGTKVRDRAGAEGLTPDDLMRMLDRSKVRIVLDTNVLISATLFLVRHQGRRGKRHSENSMSFSLKKPSLSSRQF